jgi:hypothetical protein
MGVATRSYRDTASFGKRQEYVVIAELPRRGFDVYQMLVDDQGIDYIICREKDGKLEYLDIQIKARSKDCNPRNAGRFVPLDVPSPRPNYFFVFYSEQAGAYWVLSSEDLVREAIQYKTGQNKGRYSVNFCNVRTDGTVVPRPRFDRYTNRFDLL